MRKLRRHIATRGSRRRFSIYFVEAPALNVIKIGITQDVESRVAAIRVACPTPIVLLGSIRGTAQHEHALHLRFASDRHQGEWFVATDALRSFVSDVTARPASEISRILNRLPAPPTRLAIARAKPRRPSQRERAQRLMVGLAELFHAKAAA